MLAVARRRLGRAFTALPGSFERVELPSCDAVTASLALHHIPSAARRLRLFRRLHRALVPGGVLIVADCYLASIPRIRAADTPRWLAHLERRYTARESARIPARLGEGRSLRAPDGRNAACSRAPASRSTSSGAAAASRSWWA